MRMLVSTKKSVPSKLSRARAYWRVVAKFDKNGQPLQARHYRDVGNRAYSQYLNEKK